MLKNGLFIMSIGFIFIMYSINSVTGVYQWGKVIFAIILIVVGAIIFNQGRLNDKKEKEKVQALEIQRKLNVPAEYFYDRMIHSVVYDIDQSTGRTLKKSQLEGFEYIKTFSKNNHAKIIIEKMEQNHKYQYRTVTTRNEFIASYEITPVDDQTCEVLYHESMKSIGFIQQANDFVVGLVLGYFKKKQFKAMLEGIEASY